MIYIELPFMISLLIPVILLESGLLYRYFKLHFRESIVLAGKANVLSTLVGFPLAWFLHLMIEIAFSIIPTMAHKLDLELLSAATYHNNELLIDILGLLVMAPWLAPIEAKLHWMIPAAGVISLIPAYFVTVIFEYKFLKNRISADPLLVKQTIIKINLYSYLLLAVIWSANIVYNVQLIKQNKKIFLFPLSLI